MSLVLFLGEQTTFFDASVFEGILGWFRKGAGGNYDAIAILIVLSAMMFYMIYVCFVGVFHATIMGYYEYYPGNTSPSTLLNSAFYILKFTPPICFNLLMIIIKRTDFIEKTAFYKVQ